MSKKALTHKNHAIVKQAAVATAFTTGGRAMEYLMSLTEDQVVDRGDFVEINAMKVLKQYDKVTISSPLEEEYFGHPEYRYDPTVNYRQVPIYKTDPLAQIFIDFVEKVRDGDRDLPGRYRHPDYEGMLFPYKYGWLYKWVTATDPGWWPQRFRAERASHLVSRYGYGVSALMKWFGWSSMEVALGYVKLDTSDLVRMMARGEL